MEVMLVYPDAFDVFQRAPFELTEDEHSYWLSYVCQKRTDRMRELPFRFNRTMSVERFVGESRFRSNIHLFEHCKYQSNSWDHISFYKVQLKLTSRISNNMMTGNNCHCGTRYRQETGFDKNLILYILLHSCKIRFRIHNYLYNIVLPLLFQVLVLQEEGEVEWVLQRILFHDQAQVRILIFELSCLHNCQLHKFLWVKFDRPAQMSDQFERGIEKRKTQTE
jgi:hypothetical protein